MHESEKCMKKVFVTKFLIKHQKVLFETLVLLGYILFKRNGKFIIWNKVPKNRFYPFREEKKT